MDGTQQKEKEMTKRQIAELTKTGKAIANFWLNETGKLDPNYQFTAEGDHMMVAELAEELALNMDDDKVFEEVWSVVKAGYQEVCAQ